MRGKKWGKIRPAGTISREVMRADQPAKLGGSLLFIGDDSTIIEEDVQCWHDSPPHVS
jgi:hypothetical protein